MRLYAKIWKNIKSYNFFIIFKKCFKKQTINVIFISSETAPINRTSKLSRRPNKVNWWLKDNIAGKNTSQWRKEGMSELACPLFAMSSLQKWPKLLTLFNTTALYRQKCERKLKGCGNNCRKDIFFVPLQCDDMVTVILIWFIHAGKRSFTLVFL